MKSFVITAAQETLQYDEEAQVFRALINTSDHALVSVQDATLIDETNMFATVIVVEPVVLDEDGYPHSFEELAALKEEHTLEAEQLQKPVKPKGGRRAKAQLSLVTPEAGDEE